MRMKRLVIFSSFCLIAGSIFYLLSDLYFPKTPSPPLELPYSKNPVLKPYVDIIISELNPEERLEIVSLAEEELITLHFSLSLYIRNKWLWNEAAPNLITYMESQGVTHPDNMGGIITYAVWQKLYENLPESEKRKIDLVRLKVSLKDEELRLLTEECEHQFLKRMPALKECMKASYHDLLEKHHLPAETIIIEKSGKVREVGYAALPPVEKKEKSCMDTIIKGYQFSPFEHAESVTLNAECIAKGLGIFEHFKAVKGDVMRDNVIKVDGKIVE